jgi:hypothetical protein
VNITVGAQRYIHAEKRTYMPINERVDKYTVAVLKNNVVNYQYKIDLTLESGHQVDLLFPEVPPSDFLTITGNQTNAFMAAREYREVYRLLQTETPVFFTALKVLGLSTVVLSSGPESLGEGPSDAGFVEALAAHAAEERLSTPRMEQ